MRGIIFGLVAAAMLALAPAALAQQSILEAVTEACESEITSYCSLVSPGEGRLLACFYAHEDKLSAGCLQALYDGMATLERAVEAISYVAAQCRHDIDTHCAELIPGEGRIAKCLMANKDSLSSPCAMAMDEVGLTAK